MSLRVATSTNTITEMDKPKLYRIIVVDDHPLIRIGLKAVIQKESDLECVAECESGELLFDLLKNTECDLVILDLNLPGADGFEILKELRSRYPKLKVMIHTVHQEKSFLKKSISLGAKGYFLKSDRSSSLLSAVRSIRDGEGRTLSEKMESNPFDDYSNQNHRDELTLKLLTRRELEILKLIISGLMNQQIGEHLKISVRTVEHHRANIKQKLKVKTHTDLVKVSMEMGLAEI